MTAAVVSHDKDKDAPHGKPVALIWQILALLVFLSVVVQDVTAIYGRLVEIPRSLIGIARAHRLPGDGNAVAVVDAVSPGSPAAKAGIVAGDTLSFDHPVDWQRLVAPGETIPVTVGHAGSKRHLALTTVAAPPLAAELKHKRAIDAALAGTELFGALVGGLLILRGRRRLSVLLIGLALCANNLYGTEPQVLFNGREAYFAADCVYTQIFDASALLFFAFARRFRYETTGRDGLLSRWVFRVDVVLTMIMSVFAAYAEANSYTFPLFGDGLATTAAINYAGFALALITLLAGWRDSRREERSRYGILIAAVALSMLLQVFGLMINMTGNDFSLSNPLVWGLYGAPFLGILLFIYAVLRHKVIDIGFAVNQTLIYGMVSFIVLLLFGLAEWGIEKVIPHQYVEANAFISASIALVIFLLFHRIRDVVEHVIEGVFFHKWRQNEAKLDRFVKQAGHITQPDALMKAAVAEFARFSGGAQTALYRTEGGGCTLGQGAIDGLATSLDPNLQPLVIMRAEGKPVFDDEATALHAALVLPMIQRNDLTGFVALGAKPSGDAYRPDERQVLAEAAQKIGLDLHALRIEELETKVTELDTRLRQSDHQLQQLIHAGRT